MIEVYCRLIIGGRRTFDKVPNEFKERVEERLLELGYDTDGQLLEDI